MFEPTAQKLINIANEDVKEENEKVKSKYSMVIAAAKRARQLVEEKDERVESGKNPLTIAIDEIANKVIKVIPSDKD